MNFFSPTGVCLFGKHNGTPAAKLPEGWVWWACDNVKGFRAAYEQTLAIPVAPVKLPATGRKYTLDRVPRKFIP